MKCKTCNKELITQQQQYCSKECCNQINYKVYSQQKERGLNRKKELIKRCGGKCISCGYDACIASLSFHHLDPKEKKFELSARSLSNRQWDEIEEEFKKCILLCLNCHFELHWGPKTDNGAYRIQTCGGDVIS